MGGCDQCHSYPHLRGCPNDDRDEYDEGEEFAACRYCGRSIFRGDTYFFVKRKGGKLDVYCDECVVEIDGDCF